MHVHYNVIHCNYHFGRILVQEIFRDSAHAGGKTKNIYSLFIHESDAKCRRLGRSPFLMFIGSLQNIVFPYPEPTDDQQETLQNYDGSVDPVERFFTEKGKQFLETIKFIPISSLGSI